MKTMIMEGKMIERRTEEDKERETLRHSFEQPGIDFPLTCPLCFLLESILIQSLWRPNPAPAALLPVNQDLR